MLKRNLISEYFVSQSFPCLVLAIGRTFPVSFIFSLSDTISAELIGFPKLIRAKTFQSFSDHLTLSTAKSPMQGFTCSLSIPGTWKPQPGVWCRRSCADAGGHRAAADPGGPIT